MKDFRAGFAIVRIDDYGDDEDRYTVKRVVWSRELAESEVQRLNELKADKRCRYFWESDARPADD